MSFLMVKRVMRYISIYGVRRTLAKAHGRLRLSKRMPRLWPRRPSDRSVIGCGQIAYSTIGYYLSRKFGTPYLDCYDINKVAQESLAQFHGCRAVENVEELINNKALKTLYIGSNHASHATYAVQAMEAGVREIYIEKPIAVTHEQLDELIETQRATGTTLYAGFNRPLSGAVATLDRELDKHVKIGAPFTINCHVSAQQLPEDHWYRDPKEGTRVCGNLCHWIDLAWHLMWRSLPQEITIQAAYSNEDEPDDNFCVTMTSDRHDLIVLTITARSDPFEGINETIIVHHADLIAKIDDFRNIVVWVGDKRLKRRFFPKDLGQQASVLQPYAATKRNWNEVLFSSLLTLEVADMVRNRSTHATFNVRDALERLGLDDELKRLPPRQVSMS